MLLDLEAEDLRDKKASHREMLLIWLDLQLTIMQQHVTVAT